jgi:prolyl-tRNA synthetase
MKIEGLDILIKKDLERTIKSIGKIYKNLEKNNKKHMLPKEAKSIGGTYYGSTQLFQTSGTHFEYTTNYTDYGYGCSTNYDFAFKVGGENFNDFKKIKEKFINKFNKNLIDLLIKKGFTLKQDSKNYKSFHICYDSRELVIAFVGDISYGTNFSTYCGTQIYIINPNNRNSYFKNEYIKKLIG